MEWFIVINSLSVKSYAGQEQATNKKLDKWTKFIIDASSQNEWT